MVSQTCPSGSVKLVPYMKPWSCAGCHGLPPEASARASMSSASSRESTDSALSCVVAWAGSPTVPGTKSAKRSRVSSIATICSLMTTDAVRSSLNCSLKANPRPP